MVELTTTMEYYQKKKKKKPQVKLVMYSAGEGWSW